MTPAEALTLMDAVLWWTGLVTWGVTVGVVTVWVVATVVDYLENLTSW